MPRLSVWFIRTALMYLALGFTFGGLLLFHKGVPLAREMWRLLPLHIECLFIGWTAQLALGVAYWILPRFMSGARRGDERPVWAAYALLNVGILATMGASLLPSPAWLPFAARLAEMAALALFTLRAWPRIKTFGV